MIINRILWKTNVKISPKSTQKQFILVSQKEKRVEIYNRLENTEKWLLETAEEEEEMVQVGDCIFKVKDIYRRINFQDKAEQSSDS